LSSPEGHQQQLQDGSCAVEFHCKNDIDKALRRCVLVGPSLPSAKIVDVSENLSHLPSGKLLHNYGKSQFLMGKLTISMAIFNSFLYVYP
jgi:hypothetical protein